MALNIKNPQVEQLIAEVAALSGETKTEAMRRALEERRERLMHYPASPGRATRLRRFLEQEVWPSIPAAMLGRRLTKAKEEKILGYGEHGV